MKTVSVFNNVLGPVMRGPSSSHTAASYHIGKLARDILGAVPSRVTIYFDDAGSYAKTYRQQGTDKAFVAGAMDWELTGEKFHDAERIAGREGCAFDFVTGSFEGAEHPNWVKLALEGEGRRAELVACSTGGGSVVVTEIDGFEASILGDSWVTMAECDAAGSDAALSALSSYGEVRTYAQGGSFLLTIQTGDPLPPEVTEELTKKSGARLRVVRPVFFPIKGAPLWRSAADLERYCAEKNKNIAEAALDYECALLGLSRDEAMAEMWRRYGIMKATCERALAGDLPLSMQLLNPTAQKIFAAGRSGGLAYWGLHTRAAVRALAVMHANSGMDVVVAAPTGGSAGALPAVIITLEEELKLSRDEVCLSMFAAGAIGVVHDTRATFAAEVAGCQVEIGAGGAMASAACVHAAKGSVRQALDAAAISFQNSMGSICDPVQGMVEIPCHTRNAAAAASAFVNADLIMGGYENDIPLDETVDAVFAVGKMLPPELRCTALGGIAICPSALAIERKR